ncbi:hypothetical protein GCM10010393_14690 [Streptomyces gobitricini]|uniref:Uncharacterized protein n=1 Tax=Streptomyces gobitricini TaxID=68211 RepID=A0ABN3LLR5_9ACTN
MAGPDGLGWMGGADATGPQARAFGASMGEGAGQARRRRAAEPTTPKNPKRTAQNPPGDVGSPAGCAARRATGVPTADRTAAPGEPYPAARPRRRGPAYGEHPDRLRR